MTNPVQPNQSLSGTAIYLSGPCAGYQDYNKPLFEQAEKLLPEAIMEAGFAGDNPDEFTVTIVHTHQDNVRENLASAVQLCDVIVLLPGWARKGGTVEDCFVFIAQGKRVFYFAPGETFSEMSPVVTGTEYTG